MAKIKNDKCLLGPISGRIGNLVFRRGKDQTIVSTRPKFTKPPSKKQLTQRERFKEAATYAKIATDQDSPTREVYEEVAKRKGNYAYLMAVSDWFHPPEIEEVDLSEYHGKKGDLISIEAYDRVMVKRVSVSILDEEGNEVETGEAQSPNGWMWNYTATVAVGTGEVSVVVTAEDLPGNVVKEKLEKAICVRRARRWSNTARLGWNRRSKD